MKKITLFMLVAVFTMQAGTLPRPRVHSAISGRNLLNPDTSVSKTSNEGALVCNAPTGLNAIATSPTTATVSWVETGNFTVEYGYAGFTQGTGTTVNVTTNSAVLSGLYDQTAYQFYVKRDCGNGELSTWAGPFSFSTPCYSTTYINETMEGTAVNAIPSCWNKKIVSTSTASYVGVSNSSPYQGVRSLRMGSSDAQSATLYAIAPPLSNISALTNRIRFWVAGPEGTTLQVGTMGNPADASSFTSIQTIALTTAWTQVAVNFTTPTTAGYVAFKANLNAAYSVVSIDNVIWEPMPSCADVTGLSVSNIGPTSALLTWNAVGTAYQYAIGSATDANPLALTPVAASTNSATPVLSPQTTYKVWVRNVCSGQFGEWSNSVLFTTTCTPLQASVLPWSDGFESVATVGTDAFPSCWDEENGDWTTANNALSPYDSNARTGSKFVTIAASATNEKLWTPGFTLAANVTYEFSFWYASYGTFSDWNASVLVNSYQVGTGSSVLGQPFISSGTVAPSTYTKITRTFTPTTSGTYYFGLNVSANATPWFLSFDDFGLKTSTLSTPEFAAKTVKFYPNPVRGVLNLSFEENMTEAAVYNVLGQQVIKTALNSNEATLDLSSLNSGTYIVKIATATATKTIKIAKQ